MNDKSNADADGVKTVTINGQIMYPLQPGDKMYDMVQKWDTYLSRID